MKKTIEERGKKGLEEDLERYKQEIEIIPLTPAEEEHVQFVRRLEELRIHILRQICAVFSGRPMD